MNAPLTVPVPVIANDAADERAFDPLDAAFHAAVLRGAVYVGVLVLPASVQPPLAVLDSSERVYLNGALWVPMGPDAGFDGVLIFQGCAHIVEIKQVSGPKRYSLTQNELHTCLEMERRGVTYHIVCNMTEALALVGAD